MKAPPQPEVGEFLTLPSRTTPLNSAKAWGASPSPAGFAGEGRGEGQSANDSRLNRYRASRYGETTTGAAGGDPVQRTRQPNALIACALLITLVVPRIAIAQAPLNDLLFVVGTTARDAVNTDHAYVALGSSQPLLLAGKRFAVFGKAGDANAPGTYTQRGTIEAAPSLAAVSTRLNQSMALGQDVVRLGNVLNTLLRQVAGITGQSVPQKLVTALQVAQTNATTAVYLRTLSRTHPGLALALGEAFTEPNAALTTYEIRELSPATGASIQVVGRVTIAPNAPIILPAPGRPFQLVTNLPSDDRLIRLRWGTPDTLRRLSLLSYGFNLWRLPRATAEAGGFHATPPSRAQLRTSGFTLVNEAPVPAAKDFSAGTGAGAADDPADSSTYFYADDNGRALGLPPFADGAEFYYYVTARDILGRDGDVSPGRLARACRRVRPVAPTDVRVQNDVRIVPFGGGVSSNEQRLRITWQQVEDTNSPVTEYWVYRWPNPGMIFTNDSRPQSNRVAVVTPVAGGGENSYRDVSAGAPTAAGLATYWYSVRAVSVAACDPLLSPHSGPASGVLRQREGPEAVTGSVAGSCGAPVAYSDSTRQMVVTGLESNRWHYHFICTRRDEGIAWVQFYYSNNVSTVVEYFSPVYFPPGGKVVEMDYARAIASWPPHSVEIGCVVGTFYGRVSRPAIRALNTAPIPGTRREASFQAGLLLNTALNSSDPLYLATVGAHTFCLPATSATPDPSGTVRLRFDVTARTPLFVQASSNGVSWADVALVTPDSVGFCYVSYPACLIGPLPQFRGCVLDGMPDSGDCVEHLAGTAGGQVAPVRIRFRLTRRTREYRVYRQVDGGPLTLMAQGAAAFDPANPGREIVRTDDTMPPSVAQICYYVQVLDEHGNASPMTLLGCKEVKPEKLPRPVLAEPKAVGDASSPRVALNWFCPTAGLHRFEILVRRADQDPNSTLSSGFNDGGLVQNLRLNRNFVYAGISRLAGVLARYTGGFLTPPIGAAFGPGPGFTLTANVQPRVPYKITVIARDRQEGVSEPSQEWDFTWTPPVPTTSVAWPFRLLPPSGPFDDPEPFFVFEPFRPRVQAVRLTFFNGVDQVLDPRYPVGIRIAEVSDIDPPDTVGTTNLVFLYLDANRAAYDPNTRVFRRESTDPSRAGDPLLPIVVYRQQIPSPEFPTVSGDVHQVTPLIERIPWRSLPGNGTVIPDRLIAIMNESSFACDCASRFLYLRDPQPVMLGAHYQYWVARFNAKREIAEVIDAGFVTIPASF